MAFSISFRASTSPPVESSDAGVIAVQGPRHSTQQFSAEAGPRIPGGSGNSSVLVGSGVTLETRGSAVVWSHQVSFLGDDFSVQFIHGGVRLDR